MYITFRHSLKYITFFFRLLVQLAETKTNFEGFWEKHESRLKYSLELRKFEDEFKLVCKLNANYLNMCNWLFSELYFTCSSLKKYNLHKFLEEKKPTVDNLFSRLYGIGFSHC